MDQLSHRDILGMMEPVGFLTDTRLDDQPSLHFHSPSGHIGDPGDIERPAVYAWVIRGVSASPEIIYLGKAGKGLKARCRQHEQGFKGRDGKGKSNGDKLIEYMASEQVTLYAMWPEPALFRGIEVPSHSAVEDWFLRAVDHPPALNREAAMRARAAAKEEEKAAKRMARAATGRA